MSLFPADPPASLDDRAGIVANDWSAFSGLEKLTDHWLRPGWHDGARAIYWMIVPPAGGPLREMAGTAQEAIRPLGNFDLVPLDWLHLTLHRVGSADEIGNLELPAIAETAAPVLSDVKPFDLQVGPLAGSAGAVRFSVSPWTELAMIYAKVAASARTRRQYLRKGYARI